MKRSHAKSGAKYNFFGFAFVELLVVVAIAGILLTLFLPKVQTIREATRRTPCCINNAKRISIAHNIQKYPNVCRLGSMRQIMQRLFATADRKVDSNPQWNHRNRSTDHCLKMEYVEGIVTLDGMPIEGACVTFHSPKAGESASCYSDATGKYEFAPDDECTDKGIFAGTYKVTIKKMEPNGQTNLLPRAYSTADQTPFEATVAPGKNKIDIVLQSK